MEPDRSRHYWQSIASAPRDTAIDVFYVNGTFETPTTGILHDAELQGRFWVSRATGEQVPLMFVTLWRKHQGKGKPLLPQKDSKHLH